jgi:ubiquinone/menaquinone biosynthesis C-methylase UbiE
LLKLAELHPGTNFHGLDLSEQMLELARHRAAEAESANLTFHQADITAMEDWPDNSVDVVVSTMTLHHLPDETALKRCAAESARILKPGGGLYFADFLRLKRTSTMDFFAYRRAARQAPAFTQDYANSLRAAFALDDFRRALAKLPSNARLYRSRPIGLFGVIKTPPRQKPGQAMRNRIRAIRGALDKAGQEDLKAIKTMLRVGGLRPPSGL